MPRLSLRGRGESDVEVFVEVGRHITASSFPAPKSLTSLPLIKQTYDYRYRLTIIE